MAQVAVGKREYDLAKPCAVFVENSLRRGLNFAQHTHKK
jgi:hypothetical protein